MKLSATIFVLITLLFSSCSKAMDEQERVEVVVSSSFMVDESSIDEESGETKSEQSPIPIIDTICGDVRIIVEQAGSTKRRSKTYAPQTKTSWTTTEEGSTSWKSGDAIGIYMRRSTGADPAIDVSNAKYSTLSNATSGSFTASGSALYYPENTTKRVDFYTYYPYANLAGTEPSIIKFANATDEANYQALSYILLENQTNNIAACDLMWAQKQTSKSKTSLISPFTFKHKLSLFALTLRCNQSFNGKQVTNIKLTGPKVTANGTLNLNDGTVVLGTTTFSPYNATTRTLQSSTPQYIDFIINPCTVVASTSTDAEMKLELTIASKTYSIPIRPISGSFSFLEGARHNIMVTLNTL